MLTSESAGTTYDFTDKTPSDFQSSVTVDGTTIKGTLKFIEGGLSPAGPLAGDGNFLAVKWSAPDANATSLTVGLVPSASGMDPVECIDDPDHNGVFKISSNDQKLVFKQSGAGHTNVQTFDLDLTLEDSGA